MRVSDTSQEAKFLTVKGALGVIPISRTSLYQAIKAGNLKSFRLCGRRLIAADDLMSWVNSSREV